jgi:hypothetical protein
MTLIVLPAPGVEKRRIRTSMNVWPTKLKAKFAVVFSRPGQETAVILR